MADKFTVLLSHLDKSSYGYEKGCNQVEVLFYTIRVRDGYYQIFPDGSKYQVWLRKVSSVLDFLECNI